MAPHVHTPIALQVEPQADFIFSIVERFGLPMAMLALLLWAVLRAAKWIAPRVDNMISRHEKLVDAIDNEQRKQSQVLVELRNAHLSLAASQQAILQGVQEVQRTVSRRGDG